MTTFADRPADFEQKLTGGTLSLFALGDSAFRVRFQGKPLPDFPERSILATTPAAVALEVTGEKGVTTLRLPSIRCELDAAGRLSFFDRDGRLLLAEAADGRQLTESRLAGDLVFIAEQSFELPAEERLYGTGCFQDGMLNIRGLPRRLTQVNSQISLPFMLSSRGYGLLWHNRGMSELNPPGQFVQLAEQSRGQAQIENVTTISGNAEVVRRMATFSGDIDIESGGRQAFLLDIGRKMGSRYRVEIDDNVCVDFTNLWLPPTMSFFADLAPGRHRVVVEANDTDAPVLHHGPVRDTTVWRSPVADAIDYIVIAGPGSDAIMATYRDLLGERRCCRFGPTDMSTAASGSIPPMRSSRRSMSSGGASCPWT